MSENPMQNGQARQDIAVLQAHFGDCQRRQGECQARIEKFCTEAEKRLKEVETQMQTLKSYGAVALVAVGLIGGPLMSWLVMRLLGGG